MLKSQWTHPVFNILQRMIRAFEVQYKLIINVCTMHHKVHMYMNINSWTNSWQNNCHRPVCVTLYVVRISLVCPQFITRILEQSTPADSLSDATTWGSCPCEFRVFSLLYNSHNSCCSVTLTQCCAVVIVLIAVQNFEWYIFAKETVRSQFGVQFQVHRAW